MSDKAIEIITTFLLIVLFIEMLGSPIRDIIIAWREKK